MVMNHVKDVDHKRGDGLIRLDILGEKLDKLDLEITQYVNDNVKEIIRVVIDYLEDNNDFTIWDVIPKNTNSISGEDWLRMIYELYNIVSSLVLRDYIKPKYQYLLYLILSWWQDCFEDDMELLPVNLEEEFVQKIRVKYSSEESYVLKAISTFEEYYYILFADHDFLPSALGKMVIIYLRSKQMFHEFFPDVELDEYRDLMPMDLKEQYDESKKVLFDDNVLDTEKTLYEDIIFCCEKIQADFTLKKALENTINDKVRDLLEAQGYDVKDQTRHGSSPTGKDAGNLDILIKIGKRSISLVEALRLDSVKEEYISDHINKIYKYDTLGLRFNFLISYVKTKDFKGFCNRYIKLIQEQEYPYNLIQCLICDSKQHPEIRTIETVLDREGIATKLYHVVVHMPE